LSLSRLHPQLYYSSNQPTAYTRLLLTTTPTNDALYFPKWPAGGKKRKEKKGGRDKSMTFIAKNQMSSISSHARPRLLSRSNGKFIPLDLKQNCQYHLKNIRGIEVARGQEWKGYKHSFIGRAKCSFPEMQDTTCMRTFCKMLTMPVRPTKPNHHDTSQRS